MDLVAYINMLWSAPLQIGLALYFLWDLLGPVIFEMNIFQWTIFTNSIIFSIF